MPNPDREKIAVAAINQVIQTKLNTSNGAKVQGKYVFKFFRMGKFEDVVIDDYLPGKRANPSKNEWWVPLCEKAYAKFWNSYDNIEGGFPGWALTDLTGGIAINANLYGRSKDRSKEEMFSFLSEIQNKALMCTGNDGGSAGGLVSGHAYTLLRIEQLKMNENFPVCLVKIRNPHGTGGKEWTGPWQDHDVQWDSVSESDKQRIGFKVKKDGEFWMTFDDWMQHFESVDICLLPEK